MDDLYRNSRLLQFLKMKESDVQKAILDYLGYKQIFHYRNNSGAFKTNSGGFYRFGTPGSPDIIAVIHGRFIGIECKAPKGKQSENQKMFQQTLEEAGGFYILAYSIDDVEEGLKEIHS